MNSTRLNLDTQFVSVRNIYNEYLKDNLINLRPEYQRQFSWNDDQINLFIDSLIKGFIVPSIVLLEKEDELMHYDYECVDGQHRLNVIKRFIENKVLYKVKKKNGRTYDKYYYTDGEVFCDEKRGVQQLDKKNKKLFDSAKIPVFIVKGYVDDNTIRDIFVRLQNGSKVSLFSKLKNKEHPLLDFIRDNSIMNNHKIKKLSSIFKYNFRLNEVEQNNEEETKQICERKQKKLLFFISRIFYLYKNRSSPDFSIAGLNIGLNIEKSLTNKTPNLMMQPEKVIEFYEQFEIFLLFLNYDGSIIYNEYMFLILWKYYLNNGENNIYKLSQKDIINKYNNRPEILEETPDNNKCNIIYQEFLQNELDLLA